MTGIGAILQLALLMERGQASLAVARNIGGGEDQAAGGTEPVGRGALAEGAAEAVTHVAAGRPPSALSLAGLAPPRPAGDMERQTAALLLLALNGLSQGRNAPPVPRATVPADPYGESAFDQRGEAEDSERPLAPSRPSTPDVMRPAPMRSARMPSAPMRAVPASGSADGSRDSSGATAARDREASSASRRQGIEGRPEAAPTAAPWTPGAGSTESGSPSARAGAEAALPLWFSSVDGAALQTERAGVIASFILNAAMLPGWPERRFLPQTPFTDGLAQPKAMTEEELQAYLASLGLPAQNTQQAEAARRAGRRRQWLAFITALAGQLAIAVQALQDELKLLSEAAEEVADLPDEARARMSL